MKVLIVTGGNIDNDFALDFFREIYRSGGFDEIIAVDGGLAAVAAFERLLPDGMFSLTHIVGDFDTVSPEVLSAYRQRPGLDIHAYRPEKDYTDTDIALKLAIELCRRSQGSGQAADQTGDSENSRQMSDQMVDSQDKDRAADQIVILGATGTRLDHVLANLQMLRMPLEADIDAVIVDSHNRIRMIQGEYVLRGGFGKYVSLIPVSETLEGIDLVGFRYPLVNRTVHLGESLCVSNELVAQEGFIRIRKGKALLIESED